MIPGDVTSLLRRVTDGDREAIASVLPMVYTELHDIAAARLAREPAGPIFQPTALVHEAWLRLTAAGRPPWADRRHFYRAAARVMRFLIIDQARRERRLEKARSNGLSGMRSAWEQFEDRAIDLEALDGALRGLEALSARQSDLVELHFFAGLTMAQAAEALGISERTAYSEWRLARAYLLQELSPQ